MATIHVRHSYTFKDAQGVEASLALYLTEDDGDLLSALDSEWAAMGALLNAVSGGSIIRGASAVVQPAIAAGGVDKSNGKVEQNGLFNYVVPASGRHHGIAVPAYLDSLIVAGEIPNAGATAALTAKLTGAAVDGTADMASSDFLALGALTDTALTFRKHRRQLERSRIVL